LSSPGGGIYSYRYGALTIHNSIVAGNSSATSHPDLRPGGTLTLRNSLIGDKSGTGLTEAPVGSPDIDGNLIGGPTNGVIDPLLGPLADNGGPTMTHALLAGSPAIDKGSDALAMEPGPDHAVGGGDDTPLTTDQRGAPFVRTFDVAAVPDGLAGFTDMGAFEVTVEFDFGDAPDPRTLDAGKYPTLDANGGAKHKLGSGLSLGLTVDGDADGQPTVDATGDDADADGDDENGVILPATLFAGLNAVVDVTVSADGLLDAWIDFNSDGDWDDDGERITPATGLPVVAGSNAVTFLVPATAVDGTTFARFRLSSAGGLSPGGEADDGEVEDYAVVIDVLASGCQIVADPLSPSAAADLLVCVGTNGNDKIEFLKGSAAGKVKVRVNGQTTSEFMPARLAALGLGGKDEIIVSKNLSLPGELDGGEGNDKLAAVPVTTCCAAAPARTSWKAKRGTTCCLAATATTRW